VPKKPSVSCVPQTHSTNEAPLVSVIIPVYNRRKLLQRALKSVASQTISNFEVIVIDDGSTDDSAETARAINGIDLKIIRHDRRRGAAAARNTGIREANGSYFAFLDSDDEWLPEKLEQQLNFLIDGEGRRDVCCTAYFLRKHNEIWETTIGAETSETQPNLLWGCALGPGTTLITSRTCFEQVGLFDDRLQRLEDWDWMLRCSRQYQIHVIPYPLARVYYSAETADPEHVARALEQIYEMRQKYGLSFLTPIDFIKFRSTIFLERAAIYYRGGHILRAIAFTVLSFIVYPLRNRKFFIRMGTRLINKMARRNSII
jgi:glycosyltransferase involved in cell wall biosynthesis